jgi:hypothetical protein
VPEHVEPSGEGDVQGAPSERERARLFADARGVYGSLEERVVGAAVAGMTLDELEGLLATGGRELLRVMLQAGLELVAEREERAEPPPLGGDGVVRTRVEKDHRRRLFSLFGPVTARRLAYRAAGRGVTNLHLVDRDLNLPAGAYSHSLRREIARESVRGSFDEAIDAVARAGGQTVGKRQAVEIARAAALDVPGFYARQKSEIAPAGRILVLSFDGKGIVMRPEGLRPATRKAAAEKKNHLATRLSPGEKSNRKRMAEIAVVYDAAVAPRTVDDVVASRRHAAAQAAGTAPPRAPGPTASGKWLNASVVEDIATVITAGFDEATRRDPHHQRTWVVLVDGNATQIEAVRAEAARRRVTVHLLVDLIHVIEYVWGAAWTFFDKGDPTAEAWVATQLRQLLAGRSGAVIAGILTRAKYNQYNATERKGADACVTYLRAKAPCLGYDVALANGWPIATGVVEGSCRYLIKDRFDITGARWGLDGAESVLLLRAVVANGDFDAYWAYHLEQEQQRNHHSRFAIPSPAP